MKNNAAQHIQDITRAWHSNVVGNFTVTILRIGMYS